MATIAGGLLRAPERLTAGDVEHWLEEVGPHPDAVHVELGKWKSTRHFGDAALLGAFSLWARNGADIRAAVPPLTLSGDRADRVFGDRSGRIGHHVTPTESLLADTLAGLLLGHFADLGEIKETVHGRQMRNLGDQIGIYGNGQERCQVTLIQAGQPAQKSRANIALRMARLEAALMKFLDQIAPSRVSGAPERLRNMAPIVEFAFQAWDNARDHGEVDLEGSTLQSARFLSVRRTTLGDLLKSARHLASRQAQIRDYAEQLRADLIVSGIRNPERCRLFEMTIGDGGVGVPARMSGSYDIYAKDIEEEKAILVRAMRPSGTTKSASDHAGRGGGFPVMLEAAYDFHGLALFRTGRLCAGRHFSGNQRESGVNFWRDESVAYDVLSNPVALPLTGGTAASFICPLDLSVQRQLGNLN